ncbi:hypothetical protein FRB99_006236 [Tulasnella sp. 403]|nr:hypothetical protein FRB99_006236 [Tulasnella sp. 403]
MSKRSVDTSHTSRKRQKRAIQLGAPSDLDLLSPKDRISSNALCTRPIPHRQVHDLVSIGIQVFARHMVHLYQSENTRRALKELPDLLAQRVFTALRKEQPSYLSHDFIVANFIRGTDITLTADLPGVNNPTIAAVGSLGPSIQRLELRDLFKLSDNVISSAVKALPNLEVLRVYKGCKQDRLSCRKLQAAPSLEPQLHIARPHVAHSGAILMPKFRGLKAFQPTKARMYAVISIICHSSVLFQTAGTFSAVVDEVCSSAKRQGWMPFAQLQTLKLRLTDVNESAVNNILIHTPLLRSLDVSFTKVRHLSFLGAACLVPELRKLSLTSTPLQITRWDMLSSLPHLQTLNMGAVGEVGSLTSASLRTLSDALVQLGSLETVNLVGNSRLASPGEQFSEAISDFIGRIGRNCKRLNIGGISNLRSLHLHDLVDDDLSLPRIESLVLSNTLVDDEAADYISACRNLEILELENTRVTGKRT